MSLPLPTTTSTPVRVPALAWLVVAAAAAIFYVLLQDNGVVLAGAAEYMHEFTHDGRHALGVPCH